MDWMGWITFYAVHNDQNREKRGTLHIFWIFSIHSWVLVMEYLLSYERHSVETDIKAESEQTVDAYLNN